MEETERSHADPRLPDAKRPPRVLERNIEALLEMRRRHLNERKIHDRVADRITGFVGSMSCVYLHALFFGLWILVNSKTPLVPAFMRFDPYPFVMLAMFASVEAIFLSTFVLISQNRQTHMAQKRDDLDLQINLLAEHEITSIITLIDAIAKRLDIPREEQHTAELKKDAAPEVVLESIERAEERHERETA
jgi:uncharacterized membrane protein